MEFSPNEQVIVDAIVKSKEHKIKAEDILMVGLVIGADEPTYEIMVKNPRTVTVDGVQKTVVKGKKVYITAKELGLDKEAAAGVKRASEAG